MGLGLSLIFAPMTTAVMNSVESEKSGVASAVNGAIREIGSAFGIALLGTIMNRVYKADFTADPAIREAVSNPALAPLHQVIDLFGSGASFAGRVIEDPTRFPGLPASLVTAIRDASSHAFIAGMHSAILVSSATIIGASIVSFLLIRDQQTVVAPAPAKVIDE